MAKLARILRAHEGGASLDMEGIALSLELLDEELEGAKVAQEAAEGTANLLPKVGRARPQAERSLGTPDAGAISMALCIRVVLPER